MILEGITIPDEAIQALVGEFLTGGRVTDPSLSKYERIWYVRGKKLTAYVYDAGNGWGIPLLAIASGTLPSKDQINYICGILDAALRGDESSDQEYVGEMC